MGSYVLNWEEYRVIPLKAKILAILMMSASFSYLAFYTEIPTTVVAAVGILLLGVSAYIVTRASEPPS